jgi:hypothetical protein
MLRTSESAVMVFVVCPDMSEVLAPLRLLAF